MAEYRKWPNQYKVWRGKEQTCDAVIYATKHKIKIHVQQKYLLHLYTLWNSRWEHNHYLLVCSSLKSTRERHLQKIQEYLDSLRNGLYQDIHDADILVQLLMDCTSQEINYGIRIKQQQYIVYGNGKPK